MTFTIFPSTISFTGFWQTQFNRYYQLTSSTSTFIQYELYDANGLVGAPYGSTFTSTPSGILFNVDDVGDSSTPFSYSNGSTFVGTSGIVQAGDSLTLWANATGTGTAEAVFTVPDFGVGGGPGTLSTADQASFAGTTPQTIQWKITNGSSPIPNASYFLFNETPGGVAKDSLNIGSNPVSGNVTSKTYSNPSGADFTGKWYIGYGQNSTRVNMATYSFNSKKVFCNFW